MDGVPEIDEMTAGESAWALWANSQGVETYGLCTCGHEGLGVSWHLASCRGAYEALWRKTYELFIQLYDVPPWTQEEIDAIRQRAQEAAREYQKFVD